MDLIGALGVVTVLGTAFYMASRFGRQGVQLARISDNGDSDIKIAGESTVRETPGSSEELESLAVLVKAEHDNGNIERSKRLAVALVDTVFTHDVFTSGVEDEELLSQIRLLMTFTVDVCMENGLPNPIAAQSAQNFFYEQLSLRNNGFYNEIQTSGAFSMYLLCTRSELANSTSIGNEFAALCKKEDDAEYIRLGKDIFEYYLKLCADKIRELQFVK